MIVLTEKLIKTESKGMMMGILKIADNEAFLLAFAEIEDIIENINTNENTPNKTLHKNIEIFCTGKPKKTTNKIKLNKVIVVNKPKL